MITARIQIGDGEIQDSYAGWGFIYKDSDNYFAAPEKKREKTSYAEESGVHEDLRTVADEFDYKVSFIVEAKNQNLVNANSKIKAWNDAVRESVADSDIKKCKTITFYNDYKRCKIVGIPEIVSSVGKDDFFRRKDGSVMDCVVFTLTIHVSSPELCDFDMSI